MGILVSSVAAVDVSPVADAVRRDTEAVGSAGGDGVHQIDAAVAVEHDRLAGMGLDGREEHPLLRPELTGQPSGDGSAPLRLRRGVRRRVRLERRRSYPAAHVGRILRGADDCAYYFHMVRCWSNWK